MPDETRDQGSAPVPYESRGARSIHHTGMYLGEDPLAGRLSELARRLEQPATAEDTLAEIVATAIDLIPGVDHGSISLVIGRHRIVCEAASGDLPRAVDAIQEETGQGPCVDAAYKQETVRVPDMTTERRWPEFASRAADAGARGMLSLQLFVSGNDLGALNLYSDEPGAFDDKSEHVGLMFASHAAIAYAAIRRQTELNEAVASRLVIGQALGMLMERYDLDEEQAFAVLVRASQNANVRLREVAREMVTTRQLPSAARPPE